MAGGRGALVRSGAPPDMRRRHRAAHRAIWLVLAVLLPATVLLALALRPSGPVEAPAIRLGPEP